MRLFVAKNVDDLLGRWLSTYEVKEKARSYLSATSI